MTAARYAYDALGRRIWKYGPTAAAPNVVYYYNDQWQILCEYTGDTTCRQWFTYGNYVDEVLSRNAHPMPIPAMQFYTHDHLYSPAALANYFGNAVLERYEYDAYGRVQVLSSEFSVLSSSQYANLYAFTGRQLDILDSGALHHMHYRHRDYSPKLGRFMQHDPLGHLVILGRGGLSPNLHNYFDINLYAYAKESPLLFRDSNGLRPTMEDCYNNYNQQKIRTLQTVNACHAECGISLIGIPVCAIVCIPAWGAGGGFGYLICNVVCDLPFGAVFSWCHRECNELGRIQDESSRFALENCLKRAGCEDFNVYPVR
jgi:RHS repeat-associated protein